MGALDKYIGIPFESGGRDESGVDCWGLVRMYYSDIMKIDLPSLDGKYESAFHTEIVRDLVDITKPVIKAKPVEEPRSGDIAVVKLAGIPCHVGVYLEPGYVLHAERGKDSCAERVSILSRRARIEGYYRVEN